MTQKETFTNFLGKVEDAILIDGKPEVKLEAMLIHGKAWEHAEDGDFLTGYDRLLDALALSHGRGNWLYIEVRKERENTCPFS